MKKLSNRLLIFIAIISLGACSTDDSVEFVAQPDPEGIAFTNPFSTSYILTQATLTNIAERFIWNSVDYDVPTNITYELQSAISTTFENPIILGSTPENNMAVTVQQLWDLSMEAGFDNDPETEAPNTGPLYFRVVASAGTQGEMTAISKVQTLTVLLPESTDGEEETFTYFYLVGDATAAGWDPDNNNTPLFRDPANENIYYFSGRFAGGASVEGFKLVEILGMWQPQWGVDDAGNLSNSIILGADPAAFSVANDAFYTFEMNTDDMTFTFTETDASSAPTYPTIGLIGSATPTAWDSDTDMIQSAFNPHIWYMNDVVLIDGEIKFRANDAWDVSWGSDTPLTGLGTLGGPNIPATEGTYDIWFNDLDGRYMLIPQEQ